MKKIFIFSFLSILFYSCNIQGSCGQFNIDSYELITGLDVPKTTHVDCFEDDKYRTSVFSLDVDALEASERYGGIEGYSTYFNFDRNRRPIIMNDISIGRDLNAIVNRGAVYFKEGESKSYFWRAVVIPSATELILEIERK